MTSIFALVLCASLLASGVMTTPIPQPDLVRVALIDSGINTQVVGEEHVLEGKNYVRAGYDTNDQIGHGTAVSQLILRHTPEVELVPLTYCDEVYGEVVAVELDTVSQIIVDAVDVYDCDVINISAGTYSESDDLEEAIAYAEEQGVVVVSAAGNTVSEKANYPANYDTVIGVGALNQKSEIASFSANLGVSVVALGENLQVTTAMGNSAPVTGTSFACGEVTAAVVKILKDNRNLTPQEVRETLFHQAVDICEQGFDSKSGYGKIG